MRKCRFKVLLEAPEQPLLICAANSEQTGITLA